MKVETHAAVPISMYNSDFITFEQKISKERSVKRASNGTWIIQSYLKNSERLSM